MKFLKGLLFSLVILLACSVDHVSASVPDMPGGIMIITLEDIDGPGGSSIDNPNDVKRLVDLSNQSGNHVPVSYEVLELRDGFFSIGFVIGTVHFVQQFTSEGGIVIVTEENDQI